MDVDARQSSPSTDILVHYLGRCEYGGVRDAMEAYTRRRTATSADQFWLLEHFPVYTAGRATAPDALARRAALAIPVVRTDRGGQATYHGPGQAVLYALLDLRRRALGVRRCVYLLEGAVIAFLGDCGVRAHRLAGAPGVYVRGRKIASVGLRVRGGCCYHGIALNVGMDLSPFDGIVACGMRGMRATQMADCGAAADVKSAAFGLARSLGARLDERV